MKKYFYEAIIEPEETGRFIARVPDLDIVTEGDDLADAAFAAQDAMSLVLTAHLQNGNDVAERGSFGATAPRGGYVIGIAAFADAAGSASESEMTVQEAADVLDVTRARIYALIEDGRIASRKVGSSRMVSCRDVAAVDASPRKPGRPRKTAAAPHRPRKTVEA